MKFMGQFQFNGERYPYWHHNSNNTGVNERTIEVPIGLRFAQYFSTPDFLEIGNVLWHYSGLEHKVVDLHEQIPGRPIINEDILTWSPTKKYMGVLSISTVEHTPDPERAIRRILEMGDRVMVSTPLGYNAKSPSGQLNTTDLVTRREWPGIRVLCMRRFDAANHWEEATPSEVIDTQYGGQFPFANAVAFWVKE